MLDPLENGMFNIPDYDHIEDETFPPLPPPHSPGQGGGEEADPFANGEEEGEQSKLADVPAAKRKGVKRPQPKVDSQRLISERGLPALRTLFDNVRFKGKGHEAEDLRLLMQKMENWAHRLYPKLQFDDFIDKIEKLGAKKEVQTCLKRIRLDMPLTHEDFIGKDDEEEASPEAHIFGDPDPFGGGGFPEVPEVPERPVHSTPAPPAPSTPAPPAPSMTEEQRKRMELNRQMALERRLARKQQQQTAGYLYIPVLRKRIQRWTGMPATLPQAEKGDLRQELEEQAVKLEACKVMKEALRKEKEEQTLKLDGCEMKNKGLRQEMDHIQRKLALSTSDLAAKLKAEQKEKEILHQKMEQLRLRHKQMGLSTCQQATELKAEKREKEVLLNGQA
uniref:TIMELESS-interacting protein-like n=1 Tax=Centroberyx gerrardi TaxID=166262 RepID=UPI003AABF0E1